MTDKDVLEPRRWTMAQIRAINVYRGPASPEEAAAYVEQGVMSAEDAEFLLENRRQVDAYLDRDFERRLQTLAPADLLKLEEAYRSRPPRRGGRRRMDTDPEILAGYELFLEKKRRNPRLAMKFLAANIGVALGTLKRWHAHFKGKLPPGAAKILAEEQSESK